MKIMAALKRIRLIICLVLLAGVPLALLYDSTSAVATSTQNNIDQEQRPIYFLTMKGAISPAIANYMYKGIARAQNDDAQLVVLALDTPGGLLTTTREMVTAILESPVPVAVWVTPSGAHAASAGTFITYAAHIAAMDSSTNIGAATPVEMGGPGPSPLPGQEGESDNTDDSESSRAPASPGSQKALEDTAAFIRGLAEMRGRNAEWGEKAVTEARSITATEALDLNVIDLIATSRDDLLMQIDGREITLKDGTSITLRTESAPVTEYEPDWRTRLLMMITDPNVAFILLSIGVYGIILEFSNPGALVPGTIGTICLLLAFYALNIMPVNIVGVALLILGIVFMIAEAFMPSFGILGLGGLAAFIAGATMMFDMQEMPGVGVETDIILGMAFLGALIVAATVFVTIRTYKHRVTTGTESMVGDLASVVSWDGRKGSVRTQGEIWQAFADQDLDLQQGDKVRIAALEDLKLRIETTE